MALSFDHYYLIFLHVSDKRVRCALRLACKRFRNAVDKTNTIIGVRPVEDDYQIRHCHPQILEWIGTMPLRFLDLGLVKMDEDFPHLAQIRTLEHIAMELPTERFISFLEKRRQLDYACPSFITTTTQYVRGSLGSRWGLWFPPDYNMLIPFLQWINPYSIALTIGDSTDAIPTQTRIRYYVDNWASFTAARTHSTHSVEFAICDKDRFPVTLLSDEERSSITRLDYLFYYNTIESAFSIAPNVEDLEYIVTGDVGNEQIPRIIKLLTDHPRLYINVRENNEDPDEWTYDDLTVSWHECGELLNRITFSSYTDAYFRYKHPLIMRDPSYANELKEERECPQETNDQAMMLSEHTNTW